MTSNQTSGSRWRLAFSLVDAEVKIEDGFASECLVNDNGRAQFNARYDFNRMSLWLVGKAYGVSSVEEIENWAGRFDPRSVPEWAEKVDGDWLAIILDRVCHTVSIVSDRNGATRIYYAQEGNRVALATSLWDIIPLIGAPTLSSFSAFTLLTTYYTLDPYTLIDPVKVTSPGESIEIKRAGISTYHYYKPVQVAPDYYESEAECVRELGSAFQRVFRKRVTADKTPMVLLSGGIDSVTMVRYLSELSEVPIHTLTFSVAGQEKDEYLPARIAAKHFGTVHHELLIDPGQAIDLFLQVCSAHNVPNISSMLALAVANYTSSLDGEFDFYSGEDTRLHTPDLDVVKRVSMHLNLLGGRSRYPSTQSVVAKVIRLWPWYPKGFLRNVATLIQPYDSSEEYFFHCLNKFKVPDGCDIQKSVEYDGFLTEVSEYCHVDTVEAAIRASVALSYRLQYTDNLVTRSILGGRSAHSHAPFYDWDIVQCCNRIPVHLGAKGVFTLRSWSRFMIVNKRILRRVLKGTVPASILYRRKTVASAVDVLVRGGLFGLVDSILDKWLDDFLHTVSADVRTLAETYVTEFRSGSIDMRVIYAILSICYMSLINQICLDSEFDVDVELISLREEIDNHSASLVT